MSYKVKVKRGTEDYIEMVRGKQLYHLDVSFRFLGGTMHGGHSSSGASNRRRRRPGTFLARSL